MNYHVTAYRWGYLQLASCLFSSTNLEECIAVANHYPQYRGGKYGCAVIESQSLADFMDCNYKRKIVHYAPSLHGESAPEYNHRCDVFNAVVCRIRHHEDYAKTPWVRAIIDEAEASADMLNQTMAKRKEGA